MKIAIQGHPIRGKEVIKILESLGGKNTEGLTGTHETFYYIDDKSEIGDDHKKTFPLTYTLYTLEEFEKEFPFKIGDRVISTTTNFIGTITNLKESGWYYVKYDNGNFVCAFRQHFKLYKKMKEERNIILTLDKAQEWYKKGGELKEIALQAFSEKELVKVDLPKTWEEFCESYMIDDSEAYFDTCGVIYYADITCRDSIHDKNICPSRKSAEAHLAMMQLEQLRNCWRQGWEPTKHDAGYQIIHYPGEYLIQPFHFIGFLSFPTKEMAEEFLECFRDLIEKAGDLI